MAHVKSMPAATRVNVLPPDTSVGRDRLVVFPMPSAPCVLSPQQYKRASMAIAHVWLAPASTREYLNGSTVMSAEIRAASACALTWNVPAMLPRKSPLAEIVAPVPVLPVQTAGRADSLPNWSVVTSCRRTLSPATMVAG